MTPETATLAFPELVIEMDRAVLVPTAPFGKFRLCALAVKDELFAAPDPLTATVTAGLAASLITIIAPDLLPAADGVKAMFSSACWPGAIVKGKSAPETENPGVVGLTCEIVTGAWPGFETEMDCEQVLPTATVPKVIAGGETAIMELAELLVMGGTSTGAAGAPPVSVGGVLGAVGEAPAGAAPAGAASAVEAVFAGLDALAIPVQPLTRTESADRLSKRRCSENLFGRVPWAIPRQLTMHARVGMGWMQRGATHFQLPLQNSDPYA